MTRVNDVVEHPWVDELAAEAAASRIEAGELAGVAEVRGYADAMALLTLVRTTPTLRALFEQPPPATVRNSGRRPAA